jgi:type 1 fimbriae regulatory protein FimE
LSFSHRSFLSYSHVLRHSCGYKLANDGRDTRSIQHYLGHRSIASTVRYTALAPDRFSRSDQIKEPRRTSE